jgi:hypothetical protein
LVSSNHPHVHNYRYFSSHALSSTIPCLAGCIPPPGLPPPPTGHTLYAVPSLIQPNSSDSSTLYSVPSAIGTSSGRPALSSTPSTRYAKPSTLYATPSEISTSTSSSPSARSAKPSTLYATPSSSALSPSTRSAKPSSSQYFSPPTPSSRYVRPSTLYAAPSAIHAADTGTYTEPDLTSTSGTTSTGAVDNDRVTYTAVKPRPKDGPKGHPSDTVGRVYDSIVDEHEC